MSYKDIVKKDLNKFNCKKVKNFFSFIFFKYIDLFGEDVNEAPPQEIRLSFLKKTSLFF